MTLELCVYIFQSTQTFYIFQRLFIEKSGFKITLNGMTQILNFRKLILIDLNFKKMQK